MSGFVMDWSDVKDGVPDGEYRVVLDKGTIRDSRQGNGKNLSLQLTIQDDDNEEYNGQKLFATFQIEKDGSPNKQTLPFVRRALIAFGADAEVFTGAFDLEELINEDLAGSTAVALATTTKNDRGEFQSVRIRAED